jgi:hypothetical protein
MNRVIAVINLLVWFLCCLLLSSGVAAAEKAGSVVAVRGKGFIERDQRKSEARVRDAVMVRDTVFTGEASRIRLLFLDDSVLTLGEMSRVVIREFLEGGEKGRSAIFNLIDGKLRAVVGKSAFEVHTATAVAAARGTVILFETGIRDRKKFTLMICGEGNFLARSTDSRFPEETTVSAGMAIMSVEGEPLTKPVPAAAHDKERLLNETDMTGYEISLPGPPTVLMGPWGPVTGPLGGFRTDVGLAVSQQPVLDTTPVQINVVFP